MIKTRRIHCFPLFLPLFKGKKKVWRRDWGWRWRARSARTGLTSLSVPPYYQAPPAQPRAPEVCALSPPQSLEPLPPKALEVRASAGPLRAGRAERPQEPCWKQRLWARGQICAFESELRAARSGVGQDQGRRWSRGTAGPWPLPLHLALPRPLRRSLNVEFT